MPSFSSFFYLPLLCFLLSCGYTSGGSSSIAKSIVVDQSGHGDFTTVQSAINSVPYGNKEWIRIHIKAGTYRLNMLNLLNREKVSIPPGKEYILLEGEGANWTTIAWGDHANYEQEPNPTAPASADTMTSATFSLFADNFVARGIQFVNTYNTWYTNPLRIAVAALVGGDKASFHDCTFKGFQDTLCDYLGYHYFQNCSIEGSTDFIFGFAQSMYENCTLSVVAPDTKGTVSYITAQGRDRNYPGGFVFKYSQVIGSNNAYLGRAYGPTSTVIFYQTTMSKIVVPAGWDAWNYAGHENKLIFGEYDCSGDGFRPNQRVKWEKKLSSDDVRKYTGRGYIDREGWLANRP